jgi:hypothetical protein
MDENSDNVANCLIFTGRKQAMKISTIPPEVVNCVGCVLFQEFEGEMSCMNLCYWTPDVPPQPPCYERSPGAVSKTQRLFVVD